MAEPKPDPELLSLILEGIDQAQKMYSGHGWYPSDLARYLTAHGVRVVKEGV
jgi:hypothetical protein